jgi:RES domain-containing protein
VTATVRTWRIATDTPDYGADDRTGEGARRSGGRWNRPGVPMLYASRSQALACLEVVVHLNSGDDLPLNRYLVAIELSVHDWRQRTVFDPGENVGWDARPPGLVSLDWGSNWAQGVDTLVAEVPSVIVPDESNVLLNPQHAGMSKVAISKVRRWDFDRRLA